MNIEEITADIKKRDTDIKKRNNDPKWFKQLDELGKISPEKCNTIVEQMALFSVEGDDRIVMCNVEKIDIEWKRLDIELIKADPTWTESTYNYIAPNKNAYNPEKYFKSRNDLMTGKQEEPPSIGFFENQLGFYDGRHRFSNLRDCGQLYIPCIIDVDYLHLIGKYI
jgi:hypothetical protein